MTLIQSSLFHEYIKACACMIVNTTKTNDRKIINNEGKAQRYLQSGDGYYPKIA